MDKLEVAGKIFKLKYVDGLADNGSVDFTQQVILINKNLTEEEKRSTILHEVIEILNSSYNLELSHQTISTLEIGLFSFFKYNSTFINKKKKG